MTLPDGFIPTEHFQSVIRRVYNDDVRDWFRDLGGDEWDPDIQTSRGSMRLACTHDDADSLLMTVGRMNLFDNVVRRFNTQFPSAAESDKPHRVLREGKPRITLYFWEDMGDVEPGYNPVRAKISFRLMDQSATTISQAELATYAQRIKSGFATGPGYVWRKGKVMVSYTHWELGYQLQLLCRDKSEGRRVIGDVLDLQGHIPNWAYMNTTENEEPFESYPTLPGTERILGETVRLPRRRPIADVRFQYALLTIEALNKSVTLCDRTGLLNNPIAS